MLFSHLKVTIHAQGQAPATDTQIVTRGKFTLPAPPDDPIIWKIQRHWVFRQLAAKSPCARGRPQNRRKFKNLFTMSKIRPGGMTQPGITKESGSRRHHTSGFGGGDRNRTDDLLLAKQMLSQLSYAPDKWWAWEDLNFRPHAYQACALAS